MPKIKKNPWIIRLIFYFQRKKYGQVLNSALIWAKVPRLLIAISWLYGAINHKKSLISPELRYLLIVKVSKLNGCAFCIDLNTSTLIQSGINQEKINALDHYMESNQFTPREKLALEFAQAMTQSSHSIDLALRDQMTKSFDEESLVEIAAIIAFQNMSTKFNNAFGVESQGFCALVQ